MVTVARADAPTEPSSPPSTSAAGDARPEADATRRSESRRRRFHASLHMARWGEFNLPSFPLRLATLDVPFRDTYFMGLGIAYVLLPNFTIPLGFVDASGCDIEFEGQALQHFGRQGHAELSFAFVLRTGSANLLDVLDLNFAVGEGLSLALAPPRYEKGPNGNRGVDSRHFQNHLLFELEFTLRAAPHAHLVLRLHHRSGIYGLISPQRTGSNFIGVGLRASL